MASVPTPRDQLPTFDPLYYQQVGEPNAFEFVAFYCDFNRLLESRVLTKNMQCDILEFFNITLRNDPDIDLLCAEEFQADSALKKNASPTQRNTISPSTQKKAKNYNSPVIYTCCDNYNEKELRFKLIKKKNTTCKLKDSIKFENFWNGVNEENVLHATPPPTNEVDLNLHNRLLKSQGWQGT